MSVPAGFDVDTAALRAFVGDLHNYESQTSRIGDLIGQAGEKVDHESWGIVGAFTKDKFTERLAQLRQFVDSAEQYLSTVDDKIGSAADVYDRLDDAAKKELDQRNKELEAVSAGAAVADKAGGLRVKPHHESGVFGSPHEAPGLLGEFAHGAKETVKQFKQLPDNETEAALAATAFFMVESTTFVYECIHSIGECVENPIEFLVGLGVEFLYEVLEPLQWLVQQVSGNPHALEEGSGEFMSIGQGIEGLSANFVDVSGKRLIGWEGTASTAAKKRLAEFSDGLDGLAARSASISELLEASAIVMEVIEDLLKSILTELITWLIMLWLPALAAAVVSFGSSTAAATVATFIQTGKTTGEMLSWTQKLTKLLHKLVDLWKKLAISLLKAGAKAWSASARAGHGPGTERTDEQLVEAFSQQPTETWDTTSA